MEWVTGMSQQWLPSCTRAEAGWGHCWHHVRCGGRVIIKSRDESSRNTGDSIALWALLWPDIQTDQYIPLYIYIWFSSCMCLQQDTVMMLQMVLVCLKTHLKIPEPFFLLFVLFFTPEPQKYIIIYIILYCTCVCFVSNVCMLEII